MSDSIARANHFLEIGKPYLAPDSMTVTVNSITVTNNGQGTTYYTISYTLENKTKTTIINESNFDALYANNEVGATQYGLFGTLYPGESVKRSYEFRSLTGNPYYFIQYRHNWMLSPRQLLKNSLKWKISK
jgi:hypothetical protein